MNNTIQFTCPHCSHTMELPDTLLGKQENCSACKGVVLVTKTNCPEQILLNRSDTKARIVELEGSLVEILFTEDSPVKSVTPLTRIWEKQRQLTDQMETTQSILDRLETVLPEVEHRQTEHSIASKQLKRANADIELLEKELGQTAMQGVLAGNIARNELFEGRIALHQQLVALESEKSEIGKSANADWKDQLKSKSQYVKVTAQIKVKTLKVAGLDTTIGRTLLTDGIEETMRCSETSAVLDRVSIKRTEQKEAVEKEIAARTSFSDMLQTASAIAEVSSFENAACVHSETTKLKRQLKEIQKLLTKNQSVMLEAAITTTAIRQISIVGPLVTELASLQDRLVETKPKLKDLVVKPIARWQRIPREKKNLLYGALTVALLAAIWGWAIPQDVKDGLTIALKTAVQDNDDPQPPVRNPSTPLNPTTGQKPSELETAEQFEMESELPEDPGSEAEMESEFPSDPGPEAEMESEFPSDPGPEAETPEEDLRATIMLGIEPITNTLGMQLKLIPAGTFMMGSPPDETGRDDEEHQHKVTITKPFYMQTTEVTQGQWKAVMGTEPWKGQEHSKYVKEGANYPASYVSWDDAVAYCKKLSEIEGKTYRLPTEAEWEYACRAGTETAWSFGDDEKELGDYAWHWGNAGDIDENYAHLVGLKKPNAFGLYDMHGNVFEWCHDFHGEDYYKQSPEQDPQGPESGSFRVLRGGSWLYDSRVARPAYRDRDGWSNRGYASAFRLVRELEVEDLMPRPPLAIAPSTIDARKLYLKKHINGNAVVGFRLKNTSNLLLTHVNMDIKCFDINDRVLGTDDANVQNIRPSNKAVLEFILEDIKVEEIAYWDLVIRDVRIDHGDGKEISATSRYKINMVGITEKKIADEIRLERRLSGRWKSKEGNEFIFSASADECKATTKDGVPQVFRTEVMARWYYSPEGESDKRGVDVRLHHAETGIGMQWRLVFVTKDNITGLITNIGRDGVWKEVDTTSGEKALSQWIRQENQDDLDQLKRRFAGHWSAKSGEFFFSSTGDKCSVVTSNGVTEVFRTEIMSRKQLKNDFDVLRMRLHKNESRDGFEMSFLFGQKSEEGNYLGFVSTLTGLKVAGDWKEINEEGQKKSIQLFTFVDKKTEPK